MEIFRELQTIEQPSQALFEKVIHSFPLLPKTVTIEWLAEGLPFPKSTEESETYCAKAKAQGIVPFSTQQLYYINGKGIQTFPIQASQPIYSESLFRRIERGIQNGDRAHKKIVTLGIDTWMYGSKAMEERMACLHTEILPSLKREGYQIGEGEISVLETMRGYERGEREVDTGIRFGTQGWRFYSRSGVELVIYLPETAEETKISLLHWFATLQSVNE